MFQKINEFELVEQLLHSPKHIRELARSINVSPATAMRILNTLENKRMLTSTIQGRNKLYELKETPEAQHITYAVEHYKLIKRLNNPFLRNFVKYVHEHTSEVVVVFGSYAKGTHTDASDLDVYTNNPRTAQQLRKFSHKVSVQSGKLRKESEIGQEIIKNHLILQGVEQFYKLIT